MHNFKIDSCIDRCSIAKLKVIFPSWGCSISRWTAPKRLGVDARTPAESMNSLPSRSSDTQRAVLKTTCTSEWSERMHHSLAIVKHLLVMH